MRIAAFTALLALISLSCLAQDNIVTLGNMPVNGIVGGKMTVVKTTREHILNNKKLTPISSAKILSYHFSIGTGNTMRTPIKVNGPQLTTQIINKIKETNGPNVNVLFDEIHISYQGKDVIATPLMLKYDQ